MSIATKQSRKLKEVYIANFYPNMIEDKNNAFIKYIKFGSFEK